MEYSYEEVMSYIEEEDVKFIRLAFRDAFGVQKNISVTPVEMKKAFDKGVPVNVSPIAGFKSCDAGPVYLRPQGDTMAILPWRPDSGRVLRMFCDLYTQNGEPVTSDTRKLLKDAVDAAAQMGVRFKFGTRSEFYLFLKDEEGNPTDIPYDNAGYMDIAPLDKCENIRRDISLTVEKMGMIPECSYHKSGPGQNEVDFHYSKPVKAADHLTTFKMVVSTVANKYGLAADFSPMPLKGRPGNGYHIDIHAFDEKGNNLINCVTAGILENMRDMTLFLNPRDESYSRLEAIVSPHRVMWSEAGTSSPIILDSFGSEPFARLRTPDMGSNPYLVYSLLIHAGLSALRRELSLPDRRDRAPRLPSSRREAANLAAESEFIREIVPEDIIQEYVYQYDKK